MNKDLLKKGAHNLGILLSDDQLEAFDFLFSEMKKWGAKINITALLNDEERLIEELFIDSLSPLLIINKTKHEKSNLLDIGSGGGFPGLPLKIANPSLRVTLTDAIEKKIFFIRNAIRKLDLQSAKAFKVRFGSRQPSPLCLSSFDWATSKAVTDIDQLAAWALPFLKKGGHLICLKGLHERPSQPSGYESVEELTYCLPFNNIERKLFIYKKK